MNENNNDNLDDDNLDKLIKDNYLDDDDEEECSIYS